MLRSGFGAADRLCNSQKGAKLYDVLFGLRNYRRNNCERSPKYRPDFLVAPDAHFCTFNEATVSDAYSQNRILPSARPTSIHSATGNCGRNAELRYVKTAHAPLSKRISKSRVHSPLFGKSDSREPRPRGIGLNTTDGDESGNVLSLCRQAGRTNTPGPGLGG
jgi:hypothetical protein